MKLQTIALLDLVASFQPRPILPDEVDRLAASIKEVGLIQPIVVKATTIVRGTATYGWKLIAGHHRVAACRALGWSEIDALVIDDTSHLQSELIEIDENLCRAELTKSQRTKYTKRRKQIWEALHPDDSKVPADTFSESAINIQVAQAAPPEFKPTGYASPPPQTKGFAAETAEATGMTKSSINRMVARAEVLGDDTLDKITNTSLDSGVEMDALAKLPASDRAILVQRAVAGEHVSARTEKTVQSAPVSDTPSSHHTLDLALLAKGIKQTLRGLLDEFGCLSIAELQQNINEEIKTATEDDVEALCDSIDYLEQWCKALAAIN